MGRPIRITPLLSSMLYALRRALTVETFAFGEFEPSLVRKMGSSPPVDWNRCCSSAGVIVQADDATWQEEHDLPLVPKLWKNGFDVVQRVAVDRDRAERAERIGRVDHILLAGRDRPGGQPQTDGQRPGTNAKTALSPQTKGSRAGLSDFPPRT